MMSNAPERIWHQSDTKGHSDDLAEFSIRPLDEVQTAFTEYTRTDISQAAIAAAYEVAAGYAYQQWDDDDAQEHREAIRDLTPADALATLEAVKREARMEGFRAGFEQATICDFDDWKDAWAISKMNTAQEDAP